MLRLESVSLSYWRGPSETAVLRDVSLEVNAGDLVAVYGQRNAGKTSLLKVAAGFQAPDAGRVVFEETELARFSRRAMARLHGDRIAWVERAGPHNSEWLVHDYLALPLYRRLGPREAQRRAMVALGDVGALDCAEERWEDLPDTARTLVAIAHALVREPALLVVDDPTAGLGIVDRERIVGLLRGAAEAEGIAVLMAVPDMPAMLHAHEMRLLSRGRLVGPLEPAAGSPTGGTPNVVEFPHHKRA